MGKFLRRGLAFLMVFVLVVGVVGALVVPVRGVNAHVCTEARVDNSNPTITTSWGRSYAIRANGDLYAWGRNRHNIPTWIMEDVKTVYAGNSHTMVIRNDGSLWAFGHSLHYWITNATQEDSYSLGPVWIMDDVVAVSYDHFNAWAVRSDGNLYGFGLISFLGDGTNRMILLQ